MDSKRRTVLATGAAAAAMAAVPQGLAQQAGAKTGFYEKGKVRIHYEDSGGSGFPLLVIAGGGHNSTIEAAKRGPFNPFEEFKAECRVIGCDMRTAVTGQSTGPLEVDRPWDMHTDDQLGVMDHLGIKRFMVIGFCIGGPFVWNMLRRAPDRVVAGIPAQPSGWRKEMPTLSYDSNMKGWGPDYAKQRGESMETVERYLSKMYTGPAADFVYTVSRDFVRSVKAPVLILPDDTPPHPYTIAMESAMLAQRSEVSMYPWKDTKDKIPVAVRHVRTFLRAHRPAMG